LGCGYYHHMYTPPPLPPEELARLQPRTGAEQPWEPEDLAVGEGKDPTPPHVEFARHELETLGSAAIEKTVP
jgi:hypothetical protein